MSEVVVTQSNSATRIIIKVGVLDRVGRLLAVPRPPSSAVVVTDTNVAPLYSQRVEDSVRDTGVEVQTLVVPPGESSKSLATAAQLFSNLAGFGVGRDGLIVALGGGVISDLAGFVAGTWLRGVPFAICPTTMESFVDAAIGGKTALNVPEGKNLIGVFHAPTLVAMDPSCLSTLPPRDIRAGLAESLKHGLLSSEQFLGWHEANAQRILALAPEIIDELIAWNVRFKAGLVEKDPRDRDGHRILLNLGHTVGHAIESSCGSKLRHGECVALGLVAVARASHALGLLSENERERIISVLKLFGLPTQLGISISKEEILDRMNRDKKRIGKKLRFVLLEGIGRPTVREDVQPEIIEEAVESLF